MHYVKADTAAAFLDSALGAQAPCVDGVQVSGPACEQESGASDVHEVGGGEVAAVFLKRRVQPIMSRAQPMWLYSGPKDETRVNIAELSEKELLDEVGRLTLFSQEDSIPLISLQPPFDADHPPTEVIFPFEFVFNFAASTFIISIILTQFFFDRSL